MPRNQGNRQIDAPKKGAILALSDATKLLNLQVAERLGVAESTVRNVQKHAREAEKKNIDPYSPQAIEPHHRPGRPTAIDHRTQRLLIRHATKNKAQRKKA